MQTVVTVTVTYHCGPKNVCNIGPAPLVWN